MLPFIHWLPKKIHRKILKFLNYDFLHKEENLNLISTKDFLKICKELKIKKILKFNILNFMDLNLI